MLELFSYGFFGTLSALGWAFLLSYWFYDLRAQRDARHYAEAERQRMYGHLGCEGRALRIDLALSEQALGVALMAEYNRQMDSSPPTERSLELLKEWLSPEQRTEFGSHGYFHVIGSNTHRRYRITAGTVYNVIEHDHAGAPVGNLCFTPTTISGASVIVGDIMLAQKIMLETDEYEAHRIANKRGLQSGLDL